MPCVFGHILAYFSKDIDLIQSEVYEGIFCIGLSLGKVYVFVIKFINKIKHMANNCCMINHFNERIYIISFYMTYCKI